MKIIRLTLLVFVAFLAPCSCQNSASEAEHTVTVTTDSGSHVFAVEIADSAAERSVGLMNRSSMDTDAGMYFIWGDENVQNSFWMENTYIPLDIIFIDENRQILYIAANTTPLSAEHITPPSPYRTVLEINGGEAAARGIEVGDRVELSQ